MTTVTVNASKTYDIHIGSGIISTLGQELGTVSYTHLTLPTKA